MYLKPVQKSFPWVGKRETPKGVCNIFQWVNHCRSDSGVICEIAVDAWRVKKSQVCQKKNYSCIHYMYVQDPWSYQNCHSRTITARVYQTEVSRTTTLACTKTQDYSEVFSYAWLLSAELLSWRMRPSSVLPSSVQLNKTHKCLMTPYLLSVLIHAHCFDLVLYFSDTQAKLKWSMPGYCINICPALPCPAWCQLLSQGLTAK